MSKHLLWLGALVLGCTSTPPIIVPPPATAPVADDASAPVVAAPEDPCTTELSKSRSNREALERIMTADPLCEPWFHPDFLKAVPPERLMGIRKALAEQLGAYQRATEAGGKLYATYDKGRVPVRVILGEDGKMTGLWFEAPELTGVDLKQLAASLEKLPGKTSVLVSTDGKDVVAVSPDASLAVGSAFKLAVLAAVADKVKRQGPRGWEKIVKLSEANHSLPSGKLQTWPEGTPVTVASLAAHMISISDNTATDELMTFVGRTAVEKHGGSKNRPMMTTREMFVLKDPAHRDRIERYRKGDEAARRKLLSELADAKLPGVGDIAKMPPSPDVEWFFSARELCALMDQVHALPAMRINPGLADRERWAEVAFKGGSEPGVINLTTRLEGKDGKKHCVVATWNDGKTVDEAAFTTLYRSLVSALEG